MSFREQISRKGSSKGGPIAPHDHDGADVSGDATFLILKVNQLVGGTITAQVITLAEGGRIETAASGNRVVLDADNQDALELHTGDPNQTFPGAIFAQNIVGGVWGTSIWGPTMDDAVPQAVLDLYSNATDKHADLGVDILNLGSHGDEGRILAGDGDATTPGYAFDSNANIGLYIPSGGGALGVSVGGETSRFTELGLQGIEVGADDEGGNRTFTNTSYLDLDALTGGAGSISAVRTSAVTGPRALAIWGGVLGMDTVGQATHLSCRVSGATTIAASDVWSTFFWKASASAATQRCTQMHVFTGLTPGTNDFELQAYVSANTGDIKYVDLAVIPLLV